MVIVRNSLVFFFLVTLSFLGNAQTERGSILIGGSSNLNSNFKGASQGDEIGVLISFNLAPSMGVFVVNNFVIGAELQLGFSAYGEEEYTSVGTELAAVPFARYYFGSANIKPYIHTGIGGGVNQYETVFDDYDSYTDKTKTFVFEVGGGVSFFFTESVALDLGIGIGTTSYKNDSQSYNETGLAFDVGFSVFL